MKIKKKYIGNIPEKVRNQNRNFGVSNYGCVCQ